jgi:photosystem II stability/assembly factor-like uncharacterized protein
VDLMSVSCASASSCAVVGGENAVLTTADGGVSWTGQALDLGKWLPSGVSCARACGAVGGDDSIVTSMNEGATWTARPCF